MRQNADTPYKLNIYNVVRPLEHYKVWNEHTLIYWNTNSPTEQSMQQICLATQD